jgi:peptidoglycan/LPS O-acetylase OafA/YrhL/CubicO group peptidase (beta-lactamase class C family)
MVSNVSAAPGEAEPAATRSYLPGLDGLRAFAVAAVMLYHAGYNVAGGYLGVESFFVLSGFLITTLLLAEYRNTGQINITAFWRRRARRLLPALALTLAGTFIITGVLLPTELLSLTGDTVAALGYVMNWKLVFSRQSYFDVLDRPALLQHLWSLAVEEQFYLLWPILFALGMRLLRPIGFLIGVIAAALASAALMFILFEPGVDPSRIYYATDTRASGLLIGAALALVWTPLGISTVNRRLGLAFDVVGAGMLVGLLLAYGWLFAQHPLLYRGGFQLVAIATAIIIVATTYPGARFLPRLLELRPLRWIGLRSYSLYLWHWPIFMVTRPGLDVPFHGWQLDILRFGLTIAVAAASYRLVELPLRKYGVAGVWKALSSAQRRLALWLTRLHGPFAPAIGILLILTTCTIAMALRPTNAASPLTHTIPLTSPTAAPTTAPSRTTQPFGAETDRRTTIVMPRDIPANDAEVRAVAQTPQPSGATATADPPLDPALTTELQHVLDEAVADGFVPGAVLSVSVPGYTSWTGASGLADREQGLAMEPNTRVRIASVSKMFTAVVVLQLIEEGTIKLDAPIATWLPDVVPNADTITVRQLLQHTSGLYDYLEDRAFVGQTQREPSREWKPEELVDYATQFPPNPAGRWDYSSTNYVILGMLVEQVTGQPLAQQMRQRIFAPLGMRQTSFLPQETVQGTLAHGYTKGTDITNASMSFAFATGNIATTAEELQRFGHALFREDLLQVETRDLMFQFVSGRGQYDMPELEYGLGVMRNELPINDEAAGQPRSPEAGLVLGHIGGYSGFRAALWYAPESNVVIALSLNQAQVDPNDLATHVLDAMLARIGS